MWSLKLVTSVPMVSGAPFESGKLNLRYFLRLVAWYTLQQHGGDVTSENVGHWLMTPTGGLVVMVMEPERSGLNSHPRVP